MAKKIVQNTQQHYCGDCDNAMWFYDSRNIDHNGKPICCRCKFAEYEVLRTKKACKHWKKKTK